MFRAHRLLNPWLFIERIFCYYLGMGLLSQLLKKLGFQAGEKAYRLDQDLQIQIVDLARQEQRSEEDVHASLVAAALANQNGQQELIYRWETLSPREQQVTALTCLGYTNKQIALALDLSQETVKSHIRNILVKFNLHSKTDLRLKLSDWDFSAWR